MAGLNLWKDDEQYGGDTEWDDILIKNKIKEAPIKEPTADDEYLAQVERLALRDPLAAKTLDELSDLEDEIDDDLLAQYRAKRVAELQQQKAAKRFGGVRRISKAEYKKEVNAAGKGVWVMLHLYSEGKAECDTLTQCMEALSAKFKEVKFLRILGRECIENYPDSSCPTVLFYHNDELALQETGTVLYGGDRMSPDSLEWFLHSIGVVKSTLEANPLKSGKTMDKVDASAGRNYIGRPDRGGDTRTSALSDDDEESDHDDDLLAGL